MPETNPDSRSGRGAAIAKLGAVVSAIVASSCCWLPLVLLAVGVSGASIASKMEAYRPALMVVTFGFLGAAFYFTYRPHPNQNRTDCCGETAPIQLGGCSPQPTPIADCCVPTARRRFSMITLNKAMLWAVTVLAILFLFFPKYVTGLITEGGQEITADMDRTVLQVKGMTCEG